MSNNNRAMKVLVVNCGSSSIKYQLYGMPEKSVLAKGFIERIGQDGAALEYQHGERTERREVAVADHEAGMALILETLVGRSGVLENVEEIGAVGHRVVHGGEEFTGSVVIDDKVIASVERFSDLAPLHNPPNLTGIRAAVAKLPGVPQIACFDTAFHASIPPVAYTYALPRRLYKEFGIRRYGFHGTSHRYVARRAAELLGRHKYEINCITAHLGNGCSMTAVREGRSVDTSMGLTPLEGLVMGTRSGDFDPAILFYLADHGYDMPALNKLCNKESGLLGLSGRSNDMRTLVEEAQSGNQRARLAIDVFNYRIKRYIGTYSAVLGRVDAIVFTGGIGENSEYVRRQVMNRMKILGLELDQDKNLAARFGQAGCISSSPLKALVIPTNEERVIAEDSYRLTNKD